MPQNPTRPRRARPASRPLPPTAASLQRIYRRLLQRFGRAGWWPARTPFEVCVGAILVQNTAWTNAAQAIAELRARGLLEFQALNRLRAAELEPLLRSSGYFRLKTRRLQAFLDFLGRRYAGRAEAMRGEERWRLRQALLEVPGVGRETADSIALYAAQRALFVIDAYTRRVFGRLGLVRGDEPYDELQRFFMDRLPARRALFGEFHAQIVRLAKDHCRVRPRCDDCPLAIVCPRRGVRRAC